MKFVSPLGDFATNLVSKTQGIDISSLYKEKGEKLRQLTKL